MIDVDILKRDLKFKGSIRIPYYVGRCLTCKNKNGCENINYLICDRKINTNIIKDKICINWGIDEITYNVINKNNEKSRDNRYN